MNAKTPDEVLGFEYDWLASDREGYVALFSTAGGGYAPHAFLANTDLYDSAIENLKAMPGTTSAKLAPDLADSLPNLWKILAERGIFSFDSDHFGGPYKLVAVPVSPVQLDSLPSDIVDTAKRIVLSGISFGKTGTISTQDLAKHDHGHKRAN